MAVEGIVEPGFEGVRDAFVRNFTEHGDVGAAFCLHVEGRKVVDLWGGMADAQTGRPYDESTLQLVFSTTKGATAACANLLAQRGELDIDAPVATYWPEFAAAGKERIPVRWLLCHKAGLPVIDKRLSLEEALAWDPVIEALSVQEPVWEPGSAHGYHALTYGWLVGEVIRRIDGRGLGTFFADEIAATARPRVLDRTPRVRGGTASRRSSAASCRRERSTKRRGRSGAVHRTRHVARTSTDPQRRFEWVWNERAVHAAEIGAANGITNARSLARFYAGLIGGLPDAPAAPLLTRKQVEAARAASDRGQRQVAVLRDERSGSGSSSRRRSRRTAARVRSATPAPVARWVLPIRTIRSPPVTS